MAEENSSSLPQGEEPNPKRQKMSTTTTSDDEENPENATSLPKKPRYKRRKIAIFFAYCGVGYQGMQKNPGAKTIEGDLEEALYFSGAVPEADRGLPKRFDWARSARTDKGVSAVGQVVSGRFYVDPPGFVERLNSYLSPQIRIFGFKRVTPSFNAKKFCDRRRYVYLIPVFALDPSCHRDRESVLASLGSGNELVKCLECSERGRKVFGVMGKRSAEWKTVAEAVEVGSGISSNSALGEEKIAANSSQNNETGNNDSENNLKIDAGKTGAAKNDKTEDSAVSVDPAILSNNETGLVEKRIVVTSSENRNDGADGVKNASSETGNTRETGPEDIEKMMEFEKNANGHETSEKKSEFCYGEEEKERFNRILKYYEGTHNFHNFTTRTKAEDPAAKRYILSFNANTIVSVDGIDFVKCEVVGQSFMLHQIRKMIGLAVAIMRNCAPESLIETAFRQTVNINVPMAPEVGLYLDECFFSSYNQKWKDSHEELSMKAYADEAEEFKMKYIYTHIASTEHKDGVVALWLHSLNYRNYPDLRAADSAPTSNVHENEVVDNCPSSDKRNEIVNMDE
ncbi:tRNA pseudouridine synthase A, mitochondrial-like [Sesamum indicum]|uniref:tRNA pseudouridine synthase A, mitochondrial-like n=1 Tax=Sesamum indicum TaxID=4182 RepID=A0A6I9UHU4_SESIN|nr:tRNA pseudouridine synthase A, mitochondrial-like [Sesamum indicum]